MALKAIMLRKKMNDAQKALDALREKDAEFEKREGELEKSIEETTTQEERDAVDGEIEKFESEKAEHEEAKEKLEAEVRELEQNLAAVNDTAPITNEEKAAFLEVRNQLGTNFCRRCNYCQPCTAGINISGSFLFEGYYNRYGLQDWAKGRYLAMSKTASDCVDCGICEERCPYNLPIRQMLKKVATVFGK